MTCDYGDRWRASRSICVGFLWCLLTLLALPAGGSPLGGVLKELGLKPSGSAALLSPDEAFRFSAEIKDAHTLRASWKVAEGYYLYRSKLALSLVDANGVQLGVYEFPKGEVKQDPEFGAVEVYHHDFEVTLPLKRSSGAAGSLSLRAGFQGCADRGVCYPPMHKTLILPLPVFDSLASASAESVAEPLSAPVSPAAECSAQSAAGFVEMAPKSAQCEIVESLKQDSVGLTLLSFFGMGLLLAFTPCIFPMIPILSGIIVGHGHKITSGRGFLLSLAYVVASALAYTVFGVLAGLFGNNLQALFQEPGIIITFSGLFVLLALSMFGLFTLQLPGFMQNRLSDLSRKQHGGTLLGAAAMGALSALIVGPCVAAPLAGALIYIGQSGDALLGGLALFALGMGMGAPLLVIGASAGRLLPKAGGWMNAVKGVFGVGLLAVAVWLLERVVPATAVLLLWAVLFMVSAVYLGALDHLGEGVSGWRRLWKGLGLVLLVQGVLMLIGASSGGTDPWQPLRGFQADSGGRSATANTLSFRDIRSLAAFEKELAQAKAQGQWVMLDFYADWCVSCKEMERYTFSDQSVRESLRPMVALRADVSGHSEADATLLKHFGLVGPPAVLFFDPEGRERHAFRVVGYMEAPDFSGHLKKLLQ